MKLIEKKNFFFKVKREKAKNTERIEKQIQLFFLRYYRFQIHNLKYEIGYSGTDFIDNKITVKLDFNYSYLQN